jgi:hypothetical protein
MRGIAAAVGRSFNLLGQLSSDTIVLEPLVNRPHDLIERLRLEPTLNGDLLHQAIDPFDVLDARRYGARSRGWLGQAGRSRRVLFERHEVRGCSAERYTETAYPFVYRSRDPNVGMDRVLDTDHAVRKDTAVVASDQHRPLRERDEDRIVYFELYRNFDRFFGSTIARRLDIGRQLLQ